MSEVTEAAEPLALIEVWADLGCPWCYTGKHRLQKAIDARPDAARFRVEIRSFDLDPQASHHPEPIPVVFARKYGRDTSAAMEAERQIQALAESEGLAFDVNRLNANTFDLHRVTQYAREAGKGTEFFSRVQDGFFAGQLNPYDAEALVEVAESLGLSGSRVREVLARDEYAREVRADVDEAASLGARGVPFTVFDRVLAASGAQSVAGYGRALDAAVDHRSRNSA